MQAAAMLRCGVEMGWFFGDVMPLLGLAMLCDASAVMR